MDLVEITNVEISPATGRLQCSFSLNIERADVKGNERSILLTFIAISCMKTSDNVRT